MTRRFLWGVIILLLVTNLTTLAVWMVERTSDLSEDFSIKVDKKKPVATIHNEEISYKEWLSKLEGEYGKQVLSEMIDKKVVFQLADEQGIEVNEKLIEQELSLLFTMQGVLNKEDIEDREETWAEDIRYRLNLEELLTKDISIEDSEIQAYYEENKDQYEFYESIQLSHILVDDRQTAEKLISELEEGVSFASLAREYTIDESTRNDGGYLGYFTAENDFLTSDYYAKAMEMNERSYSDPFLTENGVSVLYLHRKLPAVSFSYDELKAHIKRELALEKIKPIVSAEPLREKLEIEWIYK